MDECRQPCAESRSAKLVTLAATCAKPFDTSYPPTKTFERTFKKTIATPPSFFKSEGWSASSCVNPS